MPDYPLNCGKRLFQQGIETVHSTSVHPGLNRHNTNMIEILVIALLVWLWVIERRLNAVRDAMQSIKLDMDGFRAMRSHVIKNELASIDAPAGLPEVTSLRGSSDQKAAAS